MRKKKVIVALFATMMSVSMAVPVAAATSPKNGATTAKASVGINVVDTIQLDNNGRAKYEGTLVDVSDAYYYKFTPTQTGTLKVTTVGDNKYALSTRVRNEFSYEILGRDDNISCGTRTVNYTLSKGATYLIGVHTLMSYNYGESNYKIAFEFQPAKETFPEDYSNENEEMESAKSVELYKTYYGTITITESEDWFKFTIGSDSEVRISATGNNYKIYNSEKINITEPNNLYELKKGTYYIKFYGSGQYSFYISDGKKQNTTTSKPSTTKVTKPKATYITKLSKGSKRFKVSVKKQSATGYQVQYSTKSNFKGSKTKTFKGTSYTVKGLKGKKKYYVRVRSYKKSGSQTLYSAWSVKKSVKTKK